MLNFYILIYLFNEMKLSTYLMNSTKKEYIIIGNDYPSKTGEFLEKLEKYSNWNLTHDNIHVSYS